MSIVTSPPFGLSVTARRDGSLEAAYLRLAQGTVARTEEVVTGTLLVDVDSEGQLVGIEILRPVAIDRLIMLTERLPESQREAFETFIRLSAPPALVTS